MPLLAIGGGAIDAASLNASPVGGGIASSYLVDAVVGFLNAALTSELGSSASAPKVFADAGPPGLRMPYVIVHDPDEHYAMESEGTFTGRGHLVFNVKAVGKAQAHAIGLAIVRKLSAAADSGRIALSDGDLKELSPQSGHSAPLTEIPSVPNPPVAAERSIVFAYAVQYPSA